MRKKIFHSILLVAALAVALSLPLTLGALYRYFSGLQQSRLAEQAEWAMAGVEQNGLAYLQGIRGKETRLTWIAGDGVVLYDSQADAAQMENHLGREEVAEALRNGVGESARYSATLAAQTLYFARRLTDGSVLRLSVTQSTALTLAMGMLPSLLLLLTGAAGLSALLAGRLSRRIAQPFQNLDLEHPLDNDTYEELSPLLTRIEAQRRQLDQRMNEVKRGQEEFAAVTDSMNEGLVLLNDKGQVLSVNPAACRVFRTDEGCVGKDLLLTDRSRDVAEAVARAWETGRGEGSLTRDGREYQLEASRIGSEAQSAGLALIVFDVTERMNGERNRREFTANVSHELKTPLQSILGSAELLENGLVKPEDVPAFISRIRAEAARMIRLIEDVIRLSQLDEGGELPWEDVDLLAAAKETAASLQTAAAERNVAIHVGGESLTVKGVPRLVQEIAFNLCDNAVKYNRQGGEVTLTVSREGDGAALSVADTGAGIPPEDQSRVFERFYRVDKSHSRATGGTGLGLSIVKHAAQRMGATVGLESRPGQGTTVRVRFAGEAKSL